MQTHPHSPIHTQHSLEGHVASKPTHPTATLLTSSLGHPLIRPSTLPMLTHTTSPELLQPFWTGHSVMSSCVNGGHTEIKIMCRALLHERGNSPSLASVCSLEGVCQDHTASATLAALVLCCTPQGTAEASCSGHTTDGHCWGHKEASSYT